MEIRASDKARPGCFAEPDPTLCLNPLRGATMEQSPSTILLNPLRPDASVHRWPGLVLMLLSLGACDLILDRGQSEEALVQIEIESTRLMYWAALARRAEPGDSEALARLAAADSAIAQAIARLEGERDERAKSWNRSNRDWQEIHAQVQIALAAKNRFERDGEIQDQMLAAIAQLQSGLMTLATRETETKTPNAKTLFALTRMALTLERVQRRLPSALAGGDDATVSLDSISREIAFFSNTLDRLRHGEAAPERGTERKAAPQAELDEIIELAKPLFSATDELMENAFMRFEALDALASIESEARNLAARAGLARRFDP